MGWADEHITTLMSGKTASFRPRGNSMSGRIENGQLVTVEPLLIDTKLKANDVVLCKVRNSVYLHLIKAIGNDGRYQIGNNRGDTNGWVDRIQIFGKLISVE